MATGRTPVTDEPTEDQPYTLVVALANPANVEQLMRTAIDLAADHDGQIRVVSVIHKPATSPFLLFSDDHIKREFIGDRQAVLEQAVALAHEQSVPVNQSLLVGSNVSKTILSTIKKFDPDALLVGWQEQSRPSDIVLGTTVDPLVKRAPCDVYVERVGTTANGMDAILLPTDGGPHIDPANNLVGAIARANAATVTVVSYVHPNAPNDERETAHGNVESVKQSLAGVAVEDGVREAVTVSDAIVEAAADHDLIVLGATRERRFRRRAIGSVAEAVGQRATPPIVIAKRRAERPLLARTLGRWLSSW